MSGVANNPYKQEAPDKTLTQEGVSADAKAVGDALNNKLGVGKIIGSTADSNTCDINLESLEAGEYLLIAPRASKISTVQVYRDDVIYADSSITGTGKKLKWTVNQWYTTAYAIKIT